MNLKSCACIIQIQSRHNHPMQPPQLQLKQLNQLQQSSSSKNPFHTVVIEAWLSALTPTPSLIAHNLELQGIQLPHSVTITIDRRELCGDRRASQEPHRVQSAPQSHHPKKLVLLLLLFSEGDTGLNRSHCVEPTLARQLLRFPGRRL